MLSEPVVNRIHQMNPWLATPEKGSKLFSRFIPAPYVGRTNPINSNQQNRAVLVVGPRKAGKSTVVWHHLTPFFPNLLYLNLEDPVFRGSDPEAWDLVTFIQETLPHLQAIFLDEVQHMHEAGLFVKALVDAKLEIPLWVTGSSSYDLHARTRESLAGRAIRRRLLPFSHAELLEHGGPHTEFANTRRSQDILSHQLVYGSYPAVYSSKTANEKILLLGDLSEALILRDASDLYKIKRIDAFRRLLTLMAGQIGNLINFSEYASICNVDIGTVQTHVGILREGHIVETLPPFAGRKRREIISAPKVFFLDNGIRNQLLRSFATDWEARADKGALFENWVFSEITKVLPLQSSLKFWRSKSGAEVDFVIEHAGELHAIEVKCSRLRQPKLSRSSKSFIEAYAPDRFIVVNLEQRTTFEFNERRVDFITPYNLIGTLAEIFA